MMRRKGKAASFNNKTANSSSERPAPRSQSHIGGPAALSQSSSSHTLPKRGEDSKSSGSPRAQSAYTLTTPNNSKPPEPSTAQSNDMFSKPAPTTPQRSAVSDLLKTREREEPGRMVPPRKVATAENGGKGDDSKKSGATRPVRGSTLDNQMKRLQIINEILNTEQAYYDDLQVLLNFFVIPLRESLLIPKEEQEQIFSNIEEIVKLHADLLQRLKARLGVSDLAPNRQNGTVKGHIKLTPLSRSVSYHVGDIFFGMSEAFVAYDTFCASFKKATDAVQRCKKQEAFKNFLVQQSARPECQLLTLRDFLIKPIQRICKYPILFAELLAHTPQSHKDYQLLVQCKEKFESITTQINMSKKDAENIQNLLRIESLMTGTKEKLAVAGRKYVHEGPLVRMDSVSSSKARMRYAFLFSDIFICSKERKAFSKKEGADITTYTYEAMLPMKFGLLKSIDDQPERLHGFQLTRQDTKKSYIFYAQSKIDKDIWMRKLQRRISKSVEKDQKWKELRKSIQAPRRQPSNPALLGAYESKSQRTSVYHREAAPTSGQMDTISITDVPTLQVELYKWKKAAINQKDIISTLSKYIANEADEKKNLTNSIAQLKRQLEEETAKRIELEAKNKHLEEKIGIMQEDFSKKEEEAKELKLKRLEEAREKWRKEFQADMERKAREKKDVEDKERKVREEEELREKEEIERGLRRASVVLYEHMSKGAQQSLESQPQLSEVVISASGKVTIRSSKKGQAQKKEAESDAHLRRGSVGLWQELSQGASKLTVAPPPSSSSAITTPSPQSPKQPPQPSTPSKGTNSKPESVLVYDSDVYVSGDDWIEEEAYKNNNLTSKQDQGITIVLKGDSHENVQVTVEKDREEIEPFEEQEVPTEELGDTNIDDMDEMTEWSDDEIVDEEEEGGGEFFKTAEYLLQKFYNSPSESVSTPASSSVAASSRTEEVNLFSLLSTTDSDATSTTDTASNTSAKLGDSSPSWASRRPTSDHRGESFGSPRMGERLSEEELAFQHSIGGRGQLQPREGTRARDSIMLFFGTK